MPDMPIAAPTPETPAAPAVPAAPEAAKPAAPAEKMYKVKIDGKEEEWPESKMIERAQKSGGAEAAMQKAAELDKAFKNFVASAKDPAKLLALLQHPALQYDEEKQEALVTKLLGSKSPRVVTAVKKWLYENEIAPALMDPKEREAAELKARVAEYERKDKEAQDAKTHEERTAAEAKRLGEVKSEIGKAIDAEGLPKIEGVVARIARYAQLQVRQGRPMDVAEAAKRVKADLMAEHAARLTGLDEDALLDYLPAGVAEKINKALLRRIKAKTEPQTSTPPARKLAADGPSLKDALRDVERGRKVFQD